MEGKIAFEFFGFQLVGPNNFVTSHLIFVAALTAAFFVKQYWPDTWLPARYWRWFFILLALQATVSAFGHLSVHYGGDYLLLLSFFINTPLVYLLGMALLTEMESLSDVQRGRWKVFFIVQAVLYTFLVPVVHHFWVSISNAVVTLFTILPANIYYWYKRGRLDVFRFRLAAEWATLCAGLVYAFHLHLATWFDKDDFGHVFVALSIVFFYLSGYYVHSPSSSLSSDKL